jgi:hypothetical protein
LRGQRFVVLKIRVISGVEILSLRHTELGSFGMPQDWTDWAPPDAPAGAGGDALIIDAFSLLALANLLRLPRKTEVD